MVLQTVPFLRKYSITKFEIVRVHCPRLRDYSIFALGNPPFSYFQNASIGHVNTYQSTLFCMCLNYKGYNFER